MGLRIARTVGGLWAEVHSYSYILQANEKNIKISIKQTQTQPQYSMPHGRRRVVTALTRDQKNTNTHMHNNTRITED